MRRRTPLPVLVATLALVAALSGCNGDSDDDATPDGSTTPGGGTSTTAGDPTKSEPTKSTATETTNPNPSGSSVRRAKKSQLPAEDLPGFNDEWTWERESGGRGHTDSQPSVCLQTSLESIGGVAEFHTVYRSSLDDDAFAVQMTAVFPDQQTASLASTVLQSWHAACAQRAKNDLGLKKVKVTKLTSVSTSVGPARDWLVSYQPVPDSPNDSWYEAQGYVIDGDTMTFIVYKSAGQDYSYEPGSAPIDRALVAAADRLKNSR